MDELLQRSPEAHAHLQALAPEFQAQLGEKILQLSDASLHDVTQDRFLGTRYAPIPEEAYTGEQHDQASRVGELMAHTAELLVPAQTISEERKAAEPDGYHYVDRYNPLTIARELALQNAITAHEEGDDDRAKQGLEIMLVLGLMGTQNCEKQIRGAVANGMADDLLAVLNGMHGLIYKNSVAHQTPVASVEHIAGSSGDLLRLATNKDFDESFQHVEQLTPPGVSAEMTKRKQDILGGLDPTELVALSHQAEAQLHNPDRASSLALMALRKLGSIDNYEHPDADEVADIITTAVDTAKVMHSDEAMHAVSHELDGLRELRDAGNKYYRGNSQITSDLDKGVAELAVIGRDDVLIKLVSSSPFDIPDSVEAFDQEEHVESHLVRALTYLRDGTTPEELELAIERLVRIRQEKLTMLRQDLEQSGASQKTIEDIIYGSYDPDSALGTPPEFWAISGELHRYERPIVFGASDSSSRRIAERAQLVLDMRDAGVEPDILPEYFCIRYDRIPGSQQPEYLAKLATVSKILLPDKSDGYDLMRERRYIFQTLMEFDDPERALGLLSTLEPELASHMSAGLLVTILDGNYRSADAPPIIIDDKSSGLFLRIFSGVPGLGSVCIDQPQRMGPAVADLITAPDGEKRIDDVVDALSSGANDILTEFFTASSPLGEFYERLLVDPSPKEIAQRLVSAIRDTGLQDLINENGVAYGIKDSLLQSILASDDYVHAANQVVEIFEGGGGLWYVTSKMAEMAVAGSFYSTGATVTKIPVTLPTKTTSEYSDQAVSYISGEEMIEHLHQTYGIDQETADKMRASGGRVLIVDLPFELQQDLLTAYLYEAITMSRDAAFRAEATERNQTVTQDQLFKSDTLHHITHPRHLAAILQNGLLPGEFVTSRLRADSYPFNVDLVATPQEALQKETFGERLSMLGSRSFGNLGIHIVRARDDGFRPGAEYSPAGSGYNEHRLIPGGFPATEISAFTITDESELAIVTSAMIEAGMFVPIFNQEGEQIYDYDTYQAQRVDGNYLDVIPEIVDTQFMRPGSQAGSNEGAEFIIPGRTPGAQPTRYYCKFASVENSEHVWSELLTDQIYRAVSPSLVPETKAVILEGRLARASKIVEQDDLTVTNAARNAGFILDALVGNWDATYNANNLVMSSGAAMRIDTGNALFFRARGERKPDGQFGDIVQELEKGADPTRLGGGMRQNYPGLTVQDIETQTAELEQALTDQKIDEITESVRMSQAARDELKQVLKARRDYIIQWSKEVVSGQRTLA